MAPHHDCRSEIPCHSLVTLAPTWFPMGLLLDAHSSFRPMLLRAPHGEAELTGPRRSAVRGDGQWWFFGEDSQHCWLVQTLSYADYTVGCFVIVGIPFLSPFKNTTTTTTTITTIITTTTTTSKNISLTSNVRFEPRRSWGHISISVRIHASAYKQTFSCACVQARKCISYWVFAKLWFELNVTTASQSDN